MLTWRELHGLNTLPVYYSFSEMHVGMQVGENKNFFHFLLKIFFIEI